MNKKIRMGIIGCGNISAYHIQGVLDSPDMEVGALCDPVPVKLEEKAARFKIPKELCYSDYVEMMDSGKVDAVSICVPNRFHYKVAMDAVRRALPYALEKPVCDTEEEAKILFDETGKKGLANMVCFTYRFRAAIRYGRHLIQSGQLGAIYHINAEYLQGWGLPDAVDGKPAAFNWRLTKEHSGTGALGDLGSHMIDICRFMTGREFIKITADLDTFLHERPIPGSDKKGVVDVDDYVNLIGQLEGPVAANLSISRFAYSRGNYQRIEVYGEKGAIRCSQEDYDNTVEVNMGNWPTRMGRIWSDVPVPEEYNSDQMQSFADIVNGRGDGLAADIRDGWKSQQVIDKALAAAQSGIRQDL